MAASTSPARSAASQGAFRQYWEQSKAARTCAVAVMPLFVAYQLGILLTGGVRNGVDFLTNLLNLAFDGNMAAYLVFNGAILVGFIGAVFLLRRRQELHPRVLPLMLLESAVLALFTGFIVNTMIDISGLGGVLAAGADKEAPGLITKLVMSVGAGLYEELVFRLFLMGGMFAALTKLGGVGRIPSAIVAVVCSSLIFSAVHHVGSMGEAFTLSAFVYRFFAGVFFAALFHFRGFAIAAWTHALYDVWVMVFLGTD